MKRSMLFTILTVCLLALPFPAKGQEKGNAAKEESKTAPAVTVGAQVKMQVTVAEYEKDKKTESLPYTLIIDANHFGKLRVGSRVPIATGQNQFQYVDVGTNIDCTVLPAQDGKFQVRLQFERSFVEGTTVIGVEKSEGSEKASRQPIIHQDKFDDTFAMHDGQTLDASVAADPVSGKLVKLEVTLTILK